VLQLMLLAPEIVEAILNGRQRSEVQPDDLLDVFRWSTMVTIVELAWLAPRSEAWA
jgi:hypothetical protein